MRIKDPEVTMPNPIEVEQGNIGGLNFSRIHAPGSDKTPVVLLNGIATDPSPEHLNPDFLEGLHNTDDPANPREVLGVQYVHEDDHPSIKVFANNVMKVLDYLGLNKPVAVVGISYGNNPMLTLASRHPERVSHLISVVGFPGLTLFPLTGEAREVFHKGNRSKESVAAAYGPATYKVITADPSQLTSGQRRQRHNMLPLLEREVNDDIRRVYMEAMTSPAAGIEAVERFLGTMSLRVPGLVIGGELDRLTHPGNARALYWLMPGAQELHIGKTDDHGIIHSRPTELAAMIGRFIDETSPEPIGHVEAALSTLRKTLEVGPALANEWMAAWSKATTSFLDE